MWNILLAIVTFSVASTSSVDITEGEAPLESTYAYQNTDKQKARLTAGNSATLTLGKWSGCTIQSITLNMKSNKETGKGSLTVTVDGEEVWKIKNEKFNSEQWNGSFSTQPVDITHTFENLAVENQIKIVIEATENSLYINSYTISYTYTPPAPMPRELVLHTTADAAEQVITEETAGAGVVLPSAPNEEEWIFQGCSPKIIQSTTTMPTFYRAGEIFYPAEDTHLYALYANKEPMDERIMQTTEYTSGYYVLANNNLAMSGAIKSQQIASFAINMNFDGGTNKFYLETKKVAKKGAIIYYLDFQGDNTVKIKNYSTDKYVGWSNATFNLMIAESVWKYKILENTGTIFFYLNDYQEKSNTHGIGVKLNDELSSYVYEAFSIRSSRYYDCSFYLFAVDDPALLLQKTTYLTLATPPEPTALSNVCISKGKNGYYSLFGFFLGNDLARLKKGVYIRHQDGKTDKIYKK